LESILLLLTGLPQNFSFSTSQKLSTPTTRRRAEITEDNQQFWCKNRTLKTWQNTAPESLCSSGPQNIYRRYLQSAPTASRMDLKPSLSKHSASSAFQKKKSMPQH
jgi:hypothetical protein